MDQCHILLTLTPGSQTCSWVYLSYPSHPHQAAGPETFKSATQLSLCQTKVLTTNALLLSFRLFRIC